MEPKTPEDAIKPTLKDTTRRGFFKKAAIASVAGVGLAATEDLSASEIPTLETPHGNFYFLYERHDKGIANSTIDKLPNDIELFWKELTVGANGESNGLYDATADLLTYSARNKAAKDDDIYDKLAEEIFNNGAQIGFGDIDVPTSMDSLKLSMNLRVAGVIPFLAAHLPKLNRRNFLKGAGLAGMTIAADSLAKKAYLAIENPSTQGAIGRILQRVNGITSHSSPEQALVLFRNAVWADKFITLAETFHAGHPDKKPKIAARMGALHSGVEDFTLAGRDICQKIIMSYPKDFLQATVDMNGGITNVASTRLVRPLDQYGANGKDEGMVIDGILADKLTKLLVA